ncbi:HAD-like superfamily [Arabidopsis thaliana x Arabidopsis arenosa]|uniref:Mitochondrial import inner membrane translocase subunit TIM50 n=1 Tax=Arabidopsis thaliana x Arabidopsis arenosa TaxID=1240361 RepID=A0A8T1ZIS9_9BRAS|nr:HAD-like superfamily [Arabidopsis thaliana x Arabidopsis arenosa]
MRAIEHSVEEEPLIKKARVIDKVENCYEVPMLSLNEKAVDGNEEVSLLDVEEKNETCVASVDGSRKSGEVESNERKIEEVSELSLADRKHVVSGCETIEKLPVLEVEKNKETCVISAVTRCDEVPVIESNDSCVASSGIKGESGSNSSVLKKKLLVLDLNGLLADIVTPLKDVPADINIGRRAIFKRPYCDEFLKFCFDKFEVGIWSSRKQNNVVRITEFLLGDLKNKLLFCWDMSYCATTTVGSLENRHKYVVFKDLNRLWEKHDPRLPWKMGDYNETNTVLLDDSPYKALLNPVSYFATSSHLLRVIYTTILCLIDAFNVLNKPSECQSHIQQYSLIHTIIRTRQTHP